MTEVILRIHSVHVVNVEQCQAAADPRTKPLGLWVRLLQAAFIPQPSLPYNVSNVSGLLISIPQLQVSK